MLHCSSALRGNEKSGTLLAWQACAGGVVIQQGGWPPPSFSVLLCCLLRRYGDLAGVRNVRVSSGVDPQIVCGLVETNVLVCPACAGLYWTSLSLKAENCSFVVCPQACGNKRNGA